MPYSIREGNPMKSLTDYLTFNIPSKMAFVNITPQVQAALAESGIREGRFGKLSRFGKLRRIEQIPISLCHV